ncbi:MAG: hypothetical protein H6719_21735 [Sandaracinaceae bacterium]|nr:hypothetical protein [Sandaracinaceae bacterium]
MPTAPAAECDDATDCRMRPRGCCPACGVPELADVTAVAAGAPEDPDRCAESTCPACETEPNPNLFATCQAGHCVVVDVRQDSLSLCATDADCAVIRPDCCACRPGYVAVSAGAEADYYRRQCGEVPLCSPCEPHAIPASQVGRCVEGHCAVVEAPPADCPSECGPVDQGRCQPDGEPCTCGYLHQPFADCVPGPDHPCPSARAFTVACDPRCCP